MNNRTDMDKFNPSGVPRFSIIVPAHNEENYIRGCLDSIRKAAEPYPDQVEVVVVLNRCTDETESIAREYGAVIVREDEKCLSKIRNTGARNARGQILCTLDADSRMSPNMLMDIEKHLATGKYIGGGVAIWPEKFSIGIVLFGLMVMIPVILLWRISAGSFWVYREDFLAIGGFDETRLSAEDIDFGIRLKKYGKTRGKRYGSLWKAHITTSTRKFDTFGQWHMVVNPRLPWRLLKGKSRKDADQYYYDFKH